MCKRRDSHQSLPCALSAYLAVLDEQHSASEDAEGPVAAAELNGCLVLVMGGVERPCDSKAPAWHNGTGSTWYGTGCAGVTDVP
jgi:hypothetical protein